MLVEKKETDFSLSLSLLQNQLNVYYLSFKIESGYNSSLFILAYYAIYVILYYTMYVNIIMLIYIYRKFQDKMQPSKKKNSKYKALRIEIF